MDKEKLPPSLKAVASEYAAAQRKARDETNAANRTKTRLANAIKAFWTERQLPIGSFIRTDGMEFRYEANETTSLDEDAILKMYDDGDITREQFLRMLSITRSEAKNVLGADVVADLETTSVGSKLDVRISTLPVEQHEDEFVGIERVVRKKIKRRIFGSGEQRAAATGTVKPLIRSKRKIKTRGGK